MFTLSVPWWEFVVRAFIVYTFLLTLFRFLGKREFGQLTPFDLILLLVISNAVQNSMNAGDNSLLGGLISALTLLLLNFAMAWMAFRSKRLARVLDGEPQLVVHNGRINHDVLKRQLLSTEDLRSQIRKEGIADLSEVRYAILETDGKISVIRKEDSKG